MTLSDWLILACIVPLMQLVAIGVILVGWVVGSGILYLLKGVW